MKEVTFLKAGMQNFCCHIEPIELEFKNGKMTLITGPNGIGKTATIQSIPFTLYGSCEKGGGEDVLNNKTGKNCHTWVEWLIDNDKYRVDRYVKYKTYGNTVILKKNGKQFRKGQREVVPEIERILVPKKLFMNTLLFSQKVKTFFTDLNDSEQKEIFRKILKLEDYILFQRKAGDKLKDIIETLNDLKNQDDIKNQVMDDVDGQIERLIFDQSVFERTKTTDLERLASELKELEKEIQELNTKLDEFDLESIKTALEEANKLFAETQAHIDQIANTIQSKVDGIDSKRKQKEAEFKGQAIKVKSQLITEQNGLAQKINEEYLSYIVEKKQKIREGEKEISGNYENYLLKQKEITDKISTIERDISTIEGDIREKFTTVTDNLVTETHNYDKEITTLELSSEHKGSGVERLEIELIQIKEANNAGSVCPTCKQEICDTHGIKENIISIQNEIDDLNADIDTIDSQVDESYKFKKLVQSKMGEAREKLDETLEALSNRKDKDITLLKAEDINLHEAKEMAGQTLLEDIAKYEEEISDLETKRDSEIANSELTHNERVEESEADLKNALSKLDILCNSEIEKIGVELVEETESKTKELEELDKKIKLLNELEEDGAKISNKIYELNLDKKHREEDIKSKESEEFDTNSLDTYREKKRTIIKELKDIENQVAAYNRLQKVLEFWKEGFSSSGIQSMLIDEAIPFMNNRASHYLDKLSKGRYSVSFDTMKATKAGEFRDKISVNVFDNITHADSRVKLSGGQERIVDIATILTLSDLQSNVQNIKFNILLFDEIFDALDDSNVEYVSKLLRGVTGDKSMFIISHRHIDQIDADEILSFH